MRKKRKRLRKGRRADAGSSVPDERRGPDHDDAIGVETVQVMLSEYGPDLSRFPGEKEFVSHVTPAQAHERRQAGQEEKTEHSQHARGRRITNGCPVTAQQRDSSGGLLPQNRASDRRRRRGIRHRQEAGDAHLPTAAVGQPYLDEGMKAFEKIYAQIRLTSLRAKAPELGQQLVECT